MKPADFDYIRAITVDDALYALSERPDDTKVIAGGQSLVPLMNFRLATPSRLVDINRIESMRSISSDGGRLSLGATVRQARALADPRVRATAPLVARALTRVGHPQIRARGTIVGNLVHHDPASELPAVACALDATVTVRSTAGERTIDAEEFFLDHYTSAVGPAELAIAVHFPAAPRGTGAEFFEIARRVGDFALVGAGVQLTVSDGIVTDARIGLSAVGSRPVRARSAEAVLVGTTVDPGLPADVVREAAAQAAAEEGVTPHDDVHATADYRRRVLPTVVARALTVAVQRAVQAAGPGGKAA